jgi:hypothetical protein
VRVRVSVCVSVSVRATLFVVCRRRCFGFCLFVVVVVVVVSAFAVDWRLQDDDNDALTTTHMGDVDLAMMRPMALQSDLHRVCTRGPLLATCESATRITRMMAFMMYLRI